MGEAADDMIYGLACQMCGEFFDDVINGEDEPGHPRTCDRCLPSRKPRQQSATGAASRKTPPVLTEAHKALGFRVCSDWHWQAMTPAGRLNWWPTAGKWQLGADIFLGDEAALGAFMARLAAASDIRPPGGVFPSPADVHAAQITSGKWTREQLEAWGVPWPPTRGWRKRLAAGYEIQQRENAGG